MWNKGCKKNHLTIDVSTIHQNSRRNAAQILTLKLMFARRPDQTRAHYYCNWSNILGETQFLFLYSIFNKSKEFLESMTYDIIYKHPVTISDSVWFGFRNSACVNIFKFYWKELHFWCFSKYQKIKNRQNFKKLPGK